MTQQAAVGPMKGKVVLITGATAGIGYVAARELARAGARVLLAGRSPKSAGEAVERLRGEVADADVEPLAAELSSQDEVRKLARDVAAKTDRLDVLVNNAGGFSFERTETVDGIETTFAVNHLAPFLLTNLLLPLLRAAPSARIVNVASRAHVGAVMNFDDLEGKVGYGGWRAYKRSKLANILFTRELAGRLKGEPITVNCLHPGFVNTRIFKGATRRGKVVRLLANLFGITPEKGAETTEYLATSSDVANVSGEYFAKRRVVAPSRAALDDDAARRLWNVSAEMTRLDAGG